MLVFGLVSYGYAGGNTKSRKAVAPNQLIHVVGCLVAADFVQQYALKSLGLKVGDWAWIRYHHGSVPGMSATPDEYYVAIYSKDGNHGVLLLALPNSRRGFDAVSNSYKLTLHDSRWTADEGNGGYIVYETMGRFATELARQPRYRIQLLPGNSTCTADD